MSKYMIACVASVSLLAMIACADQEAGGAAPVTSPQDVETSDAADVQSETSAFSPIETFEIEGSDGLSLMAEVLAEFEQGWAMEFLPDGRLLVTEKEGRIKLVSAHGQILGEIAGVPVVEPEGQGGFADVILHPDFETNGKIYISYIESEDDTYGSVVDMATLNLTESGGSLADRQRIWAQSPKGDTGRHFSQRMVFDREGYLYISSGDRGLQDPAQDLTNTMGTIVRLNDDGSVPEDNPFYDQGGVTAQIWSYGHRNPLGLHIDAEGQIWSNEMGPRHGDELNRVVKAENYGWPTVSDGDNYSGVQIPDHETRDDFKVPAISWVPAISPSSLVMYSGDMFADWKGDALLGALSGQAIVRVSISDEVGTEEARYSWDMRVREIEQAPDGSLFALEDGSEGRLIRITPAQ